MAITASTPPAYPYVTVSIESDDYGTSAINIVRSDTASDSVPEVIIEGRTAGELFDADNDFYKEAVNLVAAPGGEEKLLYYINEESSERISLKDILASEANKNTFAALLRHDTIYNAAMAKRAKDDAITAQKSTHHVIYYRYAAEDAAAVSDALLEANTYAAVKAQVTGSADDHLGLSETEVAAYAEFAKDPSNAQVVPVLEKYAVKYTFSAGADPQDPDRDPQAPTEDTYSAQATEIPSPVPDLDNMEVCLPITLRP